MTDNQIKSEISFRIRFNTSHGDTDLYWRVIVEGKEYLVRSVRCDVPTFSESSFDATAGMIKFHIAGVCKEFSINEDLNAMFADAK